MAALIEVLDGGLGTTVQDSGRPGYRRHGVALSGALDPLWLACANSLAGNESGAAALELRLTGPRLRITRGRVRLALAGAAAGELRGAVSGPQTFSSWQSMTLEEGDELRIGAVRGGIAYLAVAGGIDTPPLLGSRATHQRARMGGVDGRVLAAGDCLSVGSAAPDGAERRQAAFVHDSGPIRLIAGPQDEHFTTESLRALTDAEFIVSRDADRMGLRLQGPMLVPGIPSKGSAAARARGSFISDGVAPGAIQVPADGQLILLLADCQTVGGYPKIATVIRADLPRLAHVLPGDGLRFALVSREEAVTALHAQQARLAAWSEGIATCQQNGGIDEAALYSANLISGTLYGTAVEGDEQ